MSKWCVAAAFQEAMVRWEHGRPHAPPFGAPGRMMGAPKPTNPAVGCGCSSGCRQTVEKREERKAVEAARKAEGRAREASLSVACAVCGNVGFHGPRAGRRCHAKALAAMAKLDEKATENARAAAYRARKQASHAAFAREMGWAS